MTDNLRPIAYFSTEFALTSLLPTYAGGLGILAGDMVRAAAEETFPLIGVGIYYSEGYICQKMMQDGKVIDACPIIYPETKGLTKVVDENGIPVTITLPIEHDTITVFAWEWKKDGQVVYLLDTHTSENSADNQAITNRLYVDDRMMRLKQELILGIGGVRILEKVGVRPSIYHMNEGHSSFLTLELIRRHIKLHHSTYEQATEAVKSQVVFTNHTIVSAGDETYEIDVVSLLLGMYADESQIPLDQIIALGRVDHSNIFSLTHLAFRLSAIANGVSKLHAEKAKTIWPGYEMEYVTNGVHIGTWQKKTDHTQNKKALLERITEETGVIWDEEVLLLGWARRLVSYKRPLALFEDLDRLRSIMENPDQPVRIVISGFAPPGDVHAQELFGKLQEIIQGVLKDKVVYLPNYTMELAQDLVAGCDVWVNTPVVGFEACGTSGMKALLNGVLPMTTNDGWVSESDLFDIGWVLDSTDVTKSFLNTLEQQVVPLYDMNQEKWQQMMRNGQALAEHQFSAKRMLADYKQKLYLLDK